MSLAEYFFRIEKRSETEGISDGVCDFWSVDEQGIYYFFTCISHDIYEAVDFTHCLCGFEFSFCEMLFVDWQTLQPLFQVGISDHSYFPEHEPIMRNQLIVIRGTCSGQCAKSIRPCKGYVTRLIPSCEPVRQITRDGNALIDVGRNRMAFRICNLKADKNVRIGTAVWSQKNANFADMLQEAAYWALCCKCADAVIFNLDLYPRADFSETDGAYAAIHIKNGQLKIVMGDALEKLYQKYCGYPAMDYNMEDSISDLAGFHFRFKRGDFCG